MKRILVSLMALALSNCSVPLPSSLSHSNNEVETPSHSAKEVGLDVDHALSSLKEGNQRFVNGTSIHPRAGVESRAELVKGQHPHSIILSCSDSRVPPEILFDQGLGDLFVIRTAGEIPDNAGIASIEYAVEHLGSKLIVVMGHHQCGAVKAALTTPSGSSAGSQQLDILVREIQSHMSKVDSSLATGDLDSPVKENVVGVADNLSKASTILRKAIEHGDLEIVNAVYELESGRVVFF